MLRPVVCALLLAALCLSGCGVSYSSQQPPSQWTTGFWFWNGSSTEAKWSQGPVDVLYVQVSTIERVVDSPIGPGIPRAEDWNVYAELPAGLPAAREYWFVFRYERQGVPDMEVAPAVLRKTGTLLQEARKRRLNVRGLQLDIDSPSGSLARYATFLAEVRKGLPKPLELSITALLDWFRPGTDVAGAISQVDEFVPQFYDLGEATRMMGAETIAAKVDAAKWGRTFNRFGKRFRIGISTFGRAKLVPAEKMSSGQGVYARVFADVVPIDIAVTPGFHLLTSRNAAGELVLNYRAGRNIKIGYNDFEPGDVVQFILATPEAVRAATESARQMKGRAAGVVFFRWPSENEALAMQPDEVLAAAGGATDRNGHSRVQVVEGKCAAVSCADLYLASTNPFAAAATSYVIHSSTELEYFLPEARIPVRMTGPAQLEVTLPPYCGRGSLYLGRVVSLVPGEFTVEER